MNSNNNNNNDKNKRSAIERLLAYFRSPDHVFDTIKNS